MRTDQIAIRRWFIFSTLKGSFGGSSDSTLTRLRDIQKQCEPGAAFPADELYRSLEITPSFSNVEIERIMAFRYQGRYTNLVLSLLYPDFDWKSALFHEDHIYPKSDFTVNKLKKRRYDNSKIEQYMAKYNVLPNLQLITESENLKKSARPIANWLGSRDLEYRSRHLIPRFSNYEFDHFLDFVRERKKKLAAVLRSLS